MSRLIDRIPEPAHVRERKVVIFSRSRVGTYSLYESFKVLGYRPYHMFECCSQGKLHMALLTEALHCKYRGAGKPYGRAEFDKWLADYDAIVEIPQWFIPEMAAAYPDAKVILMERELDAFWASVDKTVKPLYELLKGPLIRFLSLLDGHTQHFATLCVEIFDLMTHDKGFIEGAEDAKRDFLELNESVKKIVPEDRLLVCKLEDGFGWDEICPFLGKDIPSTKYPKGNGPKHFEKVVKGFLNPAFKKAIALAVTVVVVPAAGVGWYYVNRQVEV